MILRLPCIYTYIMRDLQADLSGLAIYLMAPSSNMNTLFNFFISWSSKCLIKFQLIFTVSIAHANLNISSIGWFVLKLRFLRSLKLYTVSKIFFVILNLTLLDSFYQFFCLTKLALLRSWCSLNIAT